MDAVAADQQLIVQGQSELSQTDPLLQREVQRLDGTHKQTYGTDAPAVWLLVQNKVGLGFRGPAPLELGQINIVQERCKRSGNVMIRFLKSAYTFGLQDMTRGFQASVCVFRSWFTCMYHMPSYSMYPALSLKCVL